MISALLAAVALAAAAPSHPIPTSAPTPTRAAYRRLDSVIFGLQAGCDGFSHPWVRIWNASDHDTANWATWTLTAADLPGYSWSNVVHLAAGESIVWSASGQTIFVSIKYPQAEAYPHTQGIGMTCPVLNPGGGPGTF